MEHWSLVQQSAVLVVLMHTYDLVLRLPWIQSSNPDVDWKHGQLLAWRTHMGADVVVVDREDHQECPGNVLGSSAREEAGSTGGGSIPGVQKLRAIALNHLLSSELVVGILFISVADCTGLLWATMESITDGEWDRPQVLDGQVGSSSRSCGRTGSTWEPQMTATDTPRHKERTGRQGLALPWANCYISRLQDSPPYHSTSSTIEN